MRFSRLPLALLAALALTPTAIRAQDPPPPDGTEVLTRGPVHEAYANAVTTQPAPGLLAPKQPPDPIEELPPDEKPAGDNVQWIPGYWAWDDDKQDFLWVSGFWRVPPPDRTWVPGAWRDVGNGQWQWTGGFWNSAVTQADLQYLPPPPAPIEAAPPPQPGPDYVYAPGNWVYHETRYVWRPGFWYAYRPGWVYVPAHYVWTPYGCIFVDGYWDYPLRQRGVLFTPVYFSAVVYRRPGFVYTPRYVVYDDALYGALFVRPGGGYYFGDYFEARYTALGYRSWFSISIGFGARDPYPYRYDPLFAYYRHANGPSWALQVNNLYVERARYPDRRPPRTLVQQTVVVNNITKNTTVINNNTTVNNVKNVTMVAPVTNVDKSVVNLTKITPQQQQAAAQTARETRQVAAKRVQAESALAATAGRPGAPAAPRTVKLDLPKPPPAAAA
ncbi:MAG TPA: YXWGXW repeat-containing protein, partial [Gemmataceae bacterium]